MLTAAQAAYYEQGRFAEVFVSLKRAPLSLLTRLREMPGLNGQISELDGRVVFDGTPAEFTDERVQQLYAGAQWDEPEALAPDPRAHDAALAALPELQPQAA